MFWGCVLKDSKPYKTQSALEDSDYPVLHISNVALPKDFKHDGKVYLLASMGKSGSSEKIDHLRIRRNQACNSTRPDSFLLASLHWIALNAPSKLTMACWICRGVSPRSF